jgi:hypothetical protein
MFANLRGTPFTKHDAIAAGYATRADWSDQMKQLYRDRKLKSAGKDAQGMPLHVIR